MGTACPLPNTALQANLAATYCNLWEIGGEPQQAGKLGLFILFLDSPANVHYVRSGGVGEHVRSGWMAGEDQHLVGLGKLGERFGG